MVTFSAILDGLIQAASIALTCTAFYFLNKRVSEKPSTIVWNVAVVFGFVLFKAGLNAVGLAASFFIPLLVMSLVSPALIWFLLKPEKKQWIILSAALVIMGLTFEKAGSTLSDLIIPSGDQYAQNAGTNPAEGRKNRQDGSISDSSQFDKQERRELSLDFSRSRELYEERKNWMNTISSDEKQAYREEMAAFMAEQGIASHRNTLAAIKRAKSSNVIILAILFTGMENDYYSEDERLRVLSEALDDVSSNLNELKLSEDDRAFMEAVSEHICLENQEDAFLLAREYIESSIGDPEVVGTVLAGIVQAESGLPMDQLLAEKLTVNMLNISSMKGLASRHWKREGKNPREEWAAALKIGEAEEVALVEEEEEPELNPFIKVTTPLGVVMVPNDYAVSDDWIAAANLLKLRGFVSLDDEVVILSLDGNMLRRGENWRVERGNYIYAFRIDKILKDRVTMHANGREWNGHGKSPDE